MTSWSPAKQSFDSDARSFRGGTFPAVGSFDPAGGAILPAQSDSSSEARKTASVEEYTEQEQIPPEHASSSRKAVSTLRAQLLAAEKRNLALRKELDAARAHAQAVEQDFSNRLGAAERFLLLKEKELRDTRFHDAASQSGDDSLLLACFEKLNEQIAHLAAVISDGLVPSDRHVQVSKHAIEQLEAVSKPAYLTVHNFLAAAAAAGATLGHVATPVARGLLCAVLYDIVLAPFAPGCTIGAHEIVDRLYSEICVRETQLHGARWRAMTYLALRPPETATDQQLIDDIVCKYFRAVHAVFACICPRSPMFSSNPNLWREHRVAASAIALTALRWRDITSTSSLTSDFCGLTLWPLTKVDERMFKTEKLPFKAPWKQDWHHHYHHQDREKDDPTVVLLTTSMSLVAVRSSETLGVPRERRLVQVASGYSVPLSALQRLAGQRTPTTETPGVHSTNKSRPQSLRSVSSQKSWDSWASWWR